MLLQSNTGVSNLDLSNLQLSKDLVLAYFFFIHHLSCAEPRFIYVGPFNFETTVFDLMSQLTLLCTAGYYLFFCYAVLEIKEVFEVFCGI